MSVFINSIEIVFLCGCLEPGRDGVGDYTRRLAGEVIRQGHHASIIALNDPHVPSETNGKKSDSTGFTRVVQNSDRSDVHVLRLSRGQSWSQRVLFAKRFIDLQQPDWLSLQFVPYSFHPKGLPLRLPGQLKLLGEGRKWHVMFHELCLGLQVGSTPKDRIIGRLQKVIILRVLGKIRVSLTHSQCAPYVHVLNQWGVPATQLRLFSNLPVSGGTESNLLYKICNDLPPKDEILLAGIFGAVHPQWPAERVLEEFEKSAAQQNKQPVFLIIGNSHLGEEWIGTLQERFRNRVDIVATGHRSEAEVSDLLNSLDLGFAASPWDLIDKSASASTMRRHGIPIVASRDDWKLRDGVQLDIYHDGVFRTVEEALTATGKLAAPTSLTDVTRQFLHDLEKGPGSI